MSLVPYFFFLDHLKTNFIDTIKMDFVITGYSYTPPELRKFDYEYYKGKASFTKESNWQLDSLIFTPQYCRRKTHGEIDFNYYNEQMIRLSKEEYDSLLNTYVDTLNRVIPIYEIK